MVAEDLPGPGTVFLHTDWRYLAPVRPGDEIVAEVEVIGVRPDKPVVTLRTTVTGPGGDIVLDGRAVTWSERLALSRRVAGVPAWRRWRCGSVSSS